MFNNKITKKVALIVASALAIGGVSSVSANAVTPYAPGADWTISSAYTMGTPVVAATSTETATQLAGPANYITLTTANTGATGYTGTYFSVVGGTTTTGTTSGTVALAGSVNIATPTVGTVTVSSYQIINGAAFTTATTTTTISVIASAPGTVYTNSTVYANSGLSVGNATTDSTFLVTAPASTANVANFNVMENDANGVALTSGFKAITATVTNGLLTASGGLSSTATTYVAGVPTNATTNLQLSGINGLSGVSTVTISVNGVVAKTYSVTFTGVAVKIVATAIHPVIALGVVSGVTANMNAIKVQEFDAAGNLVTITNPITLTPVATNVVSATPSAVAVTGVFADGSAISATAEGLSLTGLAVGSTAITVKDGTLVSAPVMVRVSSAIPTAVVYTTDAATYPTGGTGKLTVTVSDAAGTLPAGVYTLVTGAATSSLAFTVFPANLGATVTLNDMGASVAPFNAPLSEGMVTVNAVATSAVTSTAVKFAVSSGATAAGQAATDAALEAAASAKLAIDASLAAAVSADKATVAAKDAGDKASAALAAVTALSQQITTLLVKVASLSTSVKKILASISKLTKKARR